MKCYICIKEATSYFPIGGYQVCEDHRYKKAKTTHHKGGSVQVGRYEVSLGDFIEAVLANIENREIKFAIKDARYAATIRFTTRRQEDEALRGGE